MRTARLTYLVVLALILGIAESVGSAQAERIENDLMLPRPWPNPVGHTQDRTVKHAMFKAVQIGNLNVRFEETRLSEVIAAVGSGEIERAGDAAGSYYWLCFRFQKDGRTKQLGIFSDGEMGGPEHDVTDIVLSDRIVESNQQCPLLAGDRAYVVSENGLGLGSSEKDFLNRFGQPGGYNSGRTSWVFVWKIGGHGQLGPGSTAQWVHAKFNDDKAIEIIFGQTSTAD